jgi:hypothetical protein
MNATPLFNFAETQRIARAVQFNPDKPGPARDFFRSCDYPAIPFPVTDTQRKQARFYIALGSWIYARYVECGRRIPPDIADFYASNTAITLGGTDASGLFFTELYA